MSALCARDSEWLTWWESTDYGPLPDQSTVEHALTLIPKLRADLADAHRTVDQLLDKMYAPIAVQDDRVSP